MSARTQADPVHLRITPVAHGDAVALLSVFAGMSARSRYLRYHTGIRTLTSRMVSHLTDLAPGRHVAHAAWLGAEPVGLVRGAERDLIDPSALLVPVETVCAAV